MDLNELKKIKNDAELVNSHLTFVLMAQSISDFTNGSLKRNIGRDIISAAN